MEIETANITRPLFSFRWVFRLLINLVLDFLLSHRFFVGVSQLFLPYSHLTLFPILGFFSFFAFYSYFHNQPSFSQYLPDLIYFNRMLFRVLVLLHSPLPYCFDICFFLPSCIFITLYSLLYLSYFYSFFANKCRPLVSKLSSDVISSILAVSIRLG